MFDPGGVLRRKLSFEHRPQSLGQSRTLTGGGNRDLQIAPAHHRAVEEVAVGRIIDRIAPHLALLRGAENLPVDLGRGGGGDDQGSAVEIAGGKFASFPGEQPALGPAAYECLGARGNHPNGGSCREQAVDLALRHAACADHQASAAFELEKDRE
jgi:hypothetical protein